MRLSFKVKKSSKFIFDYLTDMQNFVTVHPVIFKIDKIGDDDYLVYEKLRLFYIPFKFIYPVSITKREINRVVNIRATVFKIMKIEMSFVLKTVYDYTMVEENIQFASPLPIKFIVQNIFKKQHTQLFKKIELVQRFNLSLHNAARKSGSIKHFYSIVAALSFLIMISFPL